MKHTQRLFSRMLYKKESGPTVFFSVHPICFLLMVVAVFLISSCDSVGHGLLPSFPPFVIPPSVMTTTTTTTIVLKTSTLRLYTRRLGFTFVRIRLLLRLTSLPRQGFLSHLSTIEASTQQRVVNAKGQEQILASNRMRISGSNS